MNSLKKTFVTITVLPLVIFLGQTHANVQLMDLDQYLTEIAIVDNVGHEPSEDINSIAINTGILTEFSIDHAITSELFNRIILTEYQAIDQAIPTVPEPEAYAMLLIGLCLVGLAANRRRTYYF
ncbi:PEP-CTERM sorting domain-containing protein [Nitrosomonas sp.]|uniref:PEP-CTERM sorting domain-containing protein n=1 Tax=Nitrosomonas sp. TaxID=42353 RepID=UPI001DEFC914|nr:PEP-CTERM sorting domain-containing protein [Nitrosomonas sp.]MCB1947592.1 PEP-CTERM sorting domain-containing protein [Nitrosomonas sp.]